MAAIRQRKHYTLSLQPHSDKRGGLQWMYYTQQATLQQLHDLSGIKTRATRDMLLRYLDATAHMPA